jgi:hypothetical protein
MVYMYIHIRTSLIYSLIINALLKTGTQLWVKTVGTLQGHEAIEVLYCWTSSSASLGLQVTKQNEPLKLQVFGLYNEHSLDMAANAE